MRNASALLERKRACVLSKNPRSGRAGYDFYALVKTGENCDPPPPILLITLTVNTIYGSSITLPITATSVDWGDGSIDTNVSHTYTGTGIYTIKVYGSTTKYGSASYPGVTMITAVTQWSPTLTSLSGAFTGASNLTSLPPLPAATVDISNMFSSIQNLSIDLTGWDVSRVKSMAGLFSGSQNLNIDLTNWQVGAVTDMSIMFGFANYSTYNIGNITGWNVGSVRNMSLMFANNSFNQNIGSWDVRNVTDMSSMFAGATYFVQNLSGWNVSNVRTALNMFCISGMMPPSVPYPPFATTVIGYYNTAGTIPNYFRCI